MNKRTILSSALLLAPALVSADEVQRSIDAHAESSVSISNVAGSVEVFGWSRNEVEVDADLGSGVEDLIVERDGSDIVIRVKVPRENARHVSSDLVVRLPERSSVEIGVVSADVEVRDVFGEQSLHAVSGDISAEAYEADLSAETVSGDIEIAGDGGTAVTQLGTVSGDIDALRLSGELAANTVSGDLAIAEGRFERVQAKTVNGDFVFRGALDEGARFDAESINGHIDVRLDGNVSARIDIETFNGSIRNCFGPDPKRTSRYAPGRELKFTEGDGDARITLQTLNGRVTICKE